jgi:phospholipid/cholesterol/gamma-HCH transport system substrate-binding protein
MLSNKRVLINVVAFLVASVFLAYLGTKNLVLVRERGSVLHAEFTDASGLLPRNDVTMQGVPVGAVGEVALNDKGYVDVEILLDAGVEVPEGSRAEIVRRSPIGELTMELIPGGGHPLENGDTIQVEDTLPPPDVSKTLETLADLLHEVPSEDLDTVVSELSAALDGRASDLARLTEAGVQLPERLLEIEAELRALIETGPELTGVLADNADVLADDLTQTAELADLLRDKRYDLIALNRHGADFATTAGRLLQRDKANLSCLLSDFADINSVVAAHRKDLAGTLDKNHFFFGAVEQAVQVGLDKGTWFRVQLLPHQEPAGASYAPHRNPPLVYPGRGCVSRFGRGVEATRGNVATVPDSGVSGR